MQVRTFLTRLLLGLWIVVAVPMGAFSQLAPLNSQPTDGQVPAAPPVQAASPYYVLGPQDVIEIALLGTSGFKLNQTIKPDGTIELPLIKSVTAAGKTLLELRDQVTGALTSGGFVRNPIVAITLVSPVRSVIVLGSVANPGLIPIDRPYRLSEILARVGGIRENGADYVILRPERGEPRRMAVEALVTGDVSEDPYVSAGDKIFVPKEEAFYIYGQIKTPGGYPAVSNMTLQMAIARGGGLTENGSDSRFKLKRGNVELQGVDMNTKIEPKDVIVVEEKSFFGR